MAERRAVGFATHEFSGVSTSYQSLCGLFITVVAYGLGAGGQSLQATGKIVDAAQTKG